MACCYTAGCHAGPVPAWPQHGADSIEHNCIAHNLITCNSVAHNLITYNSMTHYLIEHNLIACDLVAHNSIAHNLVVCNSLGAKFNSTQSNWAQFNSIWLNSVQFNWTQLDYTQFNWTQDNGRQSWGPRGLWPLAIANWLLAVANFYASCTNSLYRLHNEIRISEMKNSDIYYLLLCKTYKLYIQIAQKFEKNSYCWNDKIHKCLSNKHSNVKKDVKKVWKRPYFRKKLSKNVLVRIFNFKYTYYKLTRVSETHLFFSSQKLNSVSCITRTSWACIMCELASH